MIQGHIEPQSGRIRKPHRSKVVLEENEFFHSIKADEIDRFRIGNASAPDLRNELYELLVCDVPTPTLNIRLCGRLDACHWIGLLWYKWGVRATNTCAPC